MSGWLRRRGIDPEALAVWASVYLLIGTFWAVIGWAIWKALR